MLKRLWCWITLNHVDPGVRFGPRGLCCKKCGALVERDPYAAP